MQPKWIHTFIHTGGGLLLAHALTQFVTVATDEQILAMPDPLLDIPLRYAVILTGVLELAMALVCLFGKKIELQCGLLAWATTNWTVYRLGILFTGGNIQYTCMGCLTDPLHLFSGPMEVVQQWVPVCLLVGAYAAFVQRWTCKVPNQAKVYVKIPCPHCGGRIQFTDAWFGLTIPCPHCQIAIILNNK